MHSITSINDVHEVLEVLPPYDRNSDVFMAHTLEASKLPQEAHIPVHNFLAQRSNNVQVQPKIPDNWPFKNPFSKKPNLPSQQQIEAKKIQRMTEKLANQTNLDILSKELNLSFGFEVETSKRLPEETVSKLYGLLGAYGYEFTYEPTEREIKTPPNHSVMKSLRDATNLQKILALRGFAEFPSRTLHTTIGGIGISPTDTRIMYAATLIGISGGLGITERSATNPKLISLIEKFPKYYLDFNVDGNQQNLYSYYPFHKPRSAKELTVPQSFGVELRYTPSKIFSSIRSATEYLKYIQCFAIGLSSSQTGKDTQYTDLFNNHIQEIENLNRDIGLTKFISGEEIPLNRFMTPIIIKTKLDMLPDPIQQSLEASRHPFNYLMGEATVLADSENIRYFGHSLMRKYIHQISNS